MKQIKIGAIILTVAGMLTLFVYYMNFSNSKLLTNNKNVRDVLIGVILGGDDYTDAFVAYKDTMEELGYKEGVNLTYLTYIVKTNSELNDLIKKLIENKADLIHTYSAHVTKEVYKITNETETPIPIVFGAMGDPLMSGTVKSFQHTNTNVTGVASLTSELVIKRLNLLLEVMGKKDARVAMPYSSGDAEAELSVALAKEHAKKTGITLDIIPVNTPDENLIIASGITKQKYDGVLFGGGINTEGSTKLYAEVGIKENLPIVGYSTSQIKNGMLMGYGPDSTFLGRESARISAKILNGKKPSEIPIIIPTKFDIYVNASTEALLDTQFTNEFITKIDLILFNQ